MNARFASSTVAFAAMSLLSAGSFAAILDSSLFNHQYNGNVYAVPNYTEFGPFASGPSTDGNNLNFRAPTGGGYWQATDWAGFASGNPGVTVELRVKIDDDVAEGTKGSLAVYISDASAGDIMAIGKSSVGVGAGSTPTIVSNASNTDDYHVFRVTMAEDGNGAASPTINFYRDGSLIHTWANGGNGPLINGLLFGSGGSVFGGPSIHLDYIRWDNTGAWEPPVIPEPSSLALIGLGALALRRWRGR